MGNQLCKTTPQNYHQAIAPDIPQLSQPIRAYISSNKPYQNQLNQQSISHQNYPDGIYQGPLNLLNNPSGFGKLYKMDGSVYIGEFSNGKAHGDGVLIYPNGSYAHGTYNNNLLSKGQYAQQGFKYIGQFKNNKFHGEGQEINIPDGYEFKGKFNDGKKLAGVMKWRKDKISYIYQGKFTQNGDFVDGGNLPSNSGKLTEQSIGHYIGQYRNNRKHGNGTYIYVNGIKYVGQYGEGNKQGLGKLFNGDGSLSYEGTFKNGLPHGSGKAYSKDGKAVEADWVEGINKEMIKA